MRNCFVFQSVVVLSKVSYSSAFYRFVKRGDVGSSIVISGAVKLSNAGCGAVSFCFVKCFFAENCTVVYCFAKYFLVKQGDVM